MKKKIKDFDDFFKYQQKKKHIKDQQNYKAEPGIFVVFFLL